MANSFYCPYCGVLAHQVWDNARSHSIDHGDGIRLARCSHCNKLSIWVNHRLVHPRQLTAPAPNPDMPANVKEDYEEASSVFQDSPRGAAALLRLAIQKLCIHLGEGGQNLNADIASLVKKGLPEKVQKALDSVRVVGNHVVHPGQIDLKDDSDLAESLFQLVNIICEVMITEPKKVDAIFDKLPEGARKQIEKRDSQDEKK